MYLPIRRLHLFEIDDQSWSVLLPSFPLLNQPPQFISHLQVPRIPSSTCPSRSHPFLDHAPARAAISIACLPRGARAS